jgi:23S rRNA pseudouridine2457 synthase
MHHYIAFHKPYGVLSQFTPDHPGQRTLAEFNFPTDVYTIGRLDKDSEGLIILTNDGQLKGKMQDPKFAHERTYLVQVEGVPTQEKIDELSKGVLIKDYKTRACTVKMVERPIDLEERDPPVRFRANIPTSFLEITLIEGKNRQVRRMTAKIGYPTLRLIRISLVNCT